MDEEQAWALLGAERRAFADLLEGLDDARWQHPSLCGAWSVAGVSTHMMIGPTGTLASFAVAMLRARGRFHEANRLLVEAKAHRPTSAIVVDLRENADHRFTPPGSDWSAPLTDFLVHRLDVCVPLEIDHGRPLEAWSPALHYLASPGARRGFTGPGLPTLTYVATDIDHRGGTGPEVRGPAESLALAITRRPTKRLDDLDGPGAETLRTWATPGPG